MKRANTSSWKLWNRLNLAETETVLKFSFLINFEKTEEGSWKSEQDLWKTPDTEVIFNLTLLEYEHCHWCLPQILLNSIKT